MAKSNNNLVFILLGLALIVVALFLFKNMVGKSVLIFPGQGYFSVNSWQYFPKGTQLGVGIVGAVLLVFGIVKRK